MVSSEKNLSEVNQIKKEIRANLYLVIGVSVIAFCIILFYFFQLWFIDKQILSTDTSKWGEFGDYVGGVAGTILAFLTIFLLYKALITQIKEFFKISSLHQKQNSDSIFFNIMNAHNNIIANIQGVVENNNNVTEYTVLSGSLFVERLTHHFALSNVNISSDAVQENLSAKRNLFRGLVIYIDTVINMIENDIDEDDEEFYKNIFRSHLTNSELLIIAYLISDDKWNFFNKYHDKFNSFGLFEYLSLEEDINEDTDVRIAIDELISDAIKNTVNL